MTDTNEYPLSAFLPSTPYALAYTLPLLFVSLPLTFAGAFLTLDRTHSFIPRDDIATFGAPSKHKHALQSMLVLEGGIGGLFLGYAFGVQLATFLALSISSTTTSAPLSPQSFLAVWVLSGLCCAFLAGRWKYIALGTGTLVGYSTLATAVSVIVHPSLLVRIALTCVLVVIGTVLCLLPLPRFQHAALRIAASAAGAFGSVVSTALLAGVSSWGTAWQHLYVSDGENWSTPQEKGLSAGFCLLLLSGTACDWFLRKKLGENPDEEWDSYLAEYTANQPDPSGRAGTFTPLTTFWSRLFTRISGSRTAPIATDIVHPTDADLKLQPSSPFLDQWKQPFPVPPSAAVPPFDFKKRPEFFRKPKKPSVPGMRRCREAIKFRPLDEDLSSSSDEDDPATYAPLTRSLSHASTRSDTIVGDGGSQGKSGIDSIVDVAAEKAWLGRSRTRLADGADRDVLDYSDFEEDVTVSVKPREEATNNGQWSPAFLRRHSQTSTHSDPLRTTFPPASRERRPPVAPVLPYAPAPATPSLIRAVERITQAQQVAFGPLTSHAPTTDSTPIAVGGLPSPDPSPRWDMFWKEVRTKAHHPYPL